MWHATGPGSTTSRWCLAAAEKRRHRAEDMGGAILDEAVPRELSRRLHIPGTTHARRSLAAAVSAAALIGWNRWSPLREEEPLHVRQRPPSTCWTCTTQAPQAFDAGAAHTRTAAARTIPCGGGLVCAVTSQAVRRCAEPGHAGPAIRGELLVLVEPQAGQFEYLGYVWASVAPDSTPRRDTTAQPLPGSPRLQRRLPTYSLLSAAASGIGVSIPLGQKTRRLDTAAAVGHRQPLDGRKLGVLGHRIGKQRPGYWSTRSPRTRPRSVRCRVRASPATAPDAAHTATSRAAAHSVVDLLVGERVALAPMPAFAIQMSVCRTPSRRPLGRRPRGLGRRSAETATLAVQAAAGARHGRHQVHATTRRPRAASHRERAISRKSLTRPGNGDDRAFTPHRTVLSPR